MNADDEKIKPKPETSNMPLYLFRLYFYTVYSKLSLVRFPFMLHPDN